MMATNGRLSQVVKVLSQQWNRYRSLVRRILLVALIIIFHVYVVFAILYSFKKSIPVVVFLSFAYIWVVYRIINYLIDNYFEKKWKKFCDVVEKIYYYEFYFLPVFQCGILIVLVAGFAVWLIQDVKPGHTIRYRSLLALIMFLAIAFLISANPARVKWKPVFGGICLQFVFAFCVLRWETGNQAFSWFANQVVTFLDYSRNGTELVYGFAADPPSICGMSPVFIFSSLQIIIYFGSVVAVLYYYGIIQVILSQIAWIMQHTIGTTAAESLNAAACIFLGQTEAAILIEPSLATMTESEIHSVMTAGFACIAGSLFSAYISFGACPTYLMSATVMSAAVSLAVSKIIYPEVQRSKQKDMKSFKFAERDYNSVLECLSSGAVHSAKFVGAIAANLIVFTALLALANKCAGFFGTLVGFDDWSFNKLIGYCFFPLAYVMGVSEATNEETVIKETLLVAELMGIKTFLNEFIAYQELMAMKADGRLTSPRSIMIATYALCGFSNIATIGSQIGILSAMCPQRKKVFVKVVVRALIAGSISCFMTASVAGLLVSDPVTCNSRLASHCFNPEIFNSTFG